MPRKSIHFIILFSLLLSGCMKHTENQPFTYRFSMESIGNFKVKFQLNPDSTYQIVQYNYFFDKFAGKKNPLFSGGKLSGKEFDTFSKLIVNSKIEKMKASYGFTNSTAERDIIYTFELNKNSKSKFVTINGGFQERFPKDFIKLIKHTNEFISKNNNPK